MLPTLLRFAVILLLCLVVPPQAEAPPVPPSGDSTVPDSVQTVDPHAVVMLQQMSATYKLRQVLKCALISVRREGIVDRLRLIQRR